MTYAVLSDLHCHNWSMFSRVDPDGVNNRLRATLNEMLRAASELVKAGGKYMVIPGDIFHVRGSIDPEVLNPTQETIRQILDMGITIYAIPGNHDLKGKETTELGSAIQTLAQTFSEKGSFQVIYEPKLFNTPDDEYTFAFVPWHTSNEQLLSDLGQIASAAGQPDQVDVFIHAGIDGVLPGMPEHGLSDTKLAKFGFRRVMAGDYHNHKIMQGGVISVGATTHQSWRDVGSRAGFLLVTPDKVRFMDTHAPKFVDVSGRDEDEIKLLCDGNYVRFRGSQMTSEDVQELRTFFETHGALGTSIQVPPAQTSQRQGTAPVQSGQTLDQSVTAYVDKVELAPHVDRAEVKRQAADVLNKARSVYEEA